MVAGARDVDVSPSILGGFPRKEAALVEVHLIFVISEWYDALALVCLCFICLCSSFFYIVFQFSSASYVVEISLN